MYEGILLIERIEVLTLTFIDRIVGMLLFFGQHNAFSPELQISETISPLRAL